MCAAMSSAEEYRDASAAQVRVPPRIRSKREGADVASGERAYVGAVAPRLHQGPQARRVHILLSRPRRRRRLRDALGAAALTVDPGIFKAYDVRGTYPDQIDADLAYRLGRAFARVLGQLEDKPAPELSVALGRDMRLSAPELAPRYAQGL